MAQKKKKKLPKTQLVEQKKKNKWFSRKFLVWFAATMFMLITILMNMKDPVNQLAVTFMPWWGTISLAYIGGNVASDYLYKGVSKSE